MRGGERVYENIQHCLRRKGYNPCLYIISQVEPKKSVFDGEYYEVVVTAVNEKKGCRTEYVKCLVKSLARYEGAGEELD